MNGIDNFWLAMSARLGIWVVSSLSAVLMLIVPLMVLLGGFAARYRWLEGVRGFSLGWVALLGIIVGTVGALPATLAYLGVLQISFLTNIAFVLVAQLAGLAGGVGYAALFALIGRRASITTHGVVRAVAAIGKRSLSFYLLQSFIFAPVMAAWGFGLGAEMSSSAAYALALGVWLLSLALAVWLERTGRLGPAEHLLRKLSYGKYDTLGVQSQSFIAEPESTASAGDRMTAAKWRHL